MDGEETMRDNDGSGPCPVKDCGGFVSNGTCLKCGEDFNGPEWQERNHVTDGTECWCEPRIVHVPASV